jgi:ribosome-associated heat shock protein Hsp15
MTAVSDDTLRIDKWLWYARFFKTRTLAAKTCNGGGVRCSGVNISKAHHPVRAGDVLTFSQGHHVRVVRVLALGERRGAAAEARTLYEDLKPPETSRAIPQTEPVGYRPPGAGRPTKKARRLLDWLRGGG